MIDTKKPPPLWMFVIVFGALFIVWSLPDDDSKPNKPAVRSSSYDGSVRQVKTYLKRNLKDPDSFEAIEWSPLNKQSNGGYMVRCKYRAKNSYGGYVVENQVFYLDSKGNVTGYDNY